MTMWDNLEDCKNQLVGTIVRHNGRAVTVRSVDSRQGEIVCELIRLSDKKGSLTKLKFLELSPVKLGYVNGMGTSRYICRTASRRWKHGLDSSNTREVIDGETLGFRHFTFMNKGISAAIENNYPTLSASLTHLKEGLVEKVAFSRLFAISDTFLYYRGSVVGKVVGEELVLDNEARYLQELLDEETRHVG